MVNKLGVGKRTVLVLHFDNTSQRENLMKASKLSGLASKFNAYFSKKSIQKSLAVIFKVENSFTFMLTLVSVFFL